MAAKPVNVDGARGMMGSLADDMTDDDIRQALVRLAAEYTGDPPQQVAPSIPRFPAAAERLQRP